MMAATMETTARERPPLASPLSPSLKSARGLLRPAPHPLLWPHTEAECRECESALLELPDDEAATLARTLLDRAAQIEAAQADPLTYGIEPELWRDFDQDIAEAEMLYISGPNRSTKSFYCVKRVVEAALAYPRGAILVLGKTEISSEQIQQRLLWQFLVAHVGHLNGKHHPLYKIRYSDAGGFTEGLTVLPNGTKIVIQTDNKEPKPWEGEEWGARFAEPALRKDGTPILNIGFWLDEDISLKWIEHATRRSRYREAKGLWSFTPVDGITPAIKELLTGAKMVESRPARLLPEARLLDGPRGHMPYRLQCNWQRAKVRVCYVHIDSNPMPDYRAKELKRLEGASQEMIERFGYGFARDSITRALPQFGPWNIVDDEDLPEIGTNYVVCDPHEARAWFITWVRVTPGDEPDFYIYDEWPEASLYGEWAVPSSRELNRDNVAGWDGDMGPAQHARVDGITGYKKIFREKNLILVGVEEHDPMRRKMQSGAGARTIGPPPPAGRSDAPRSGRRLVPIEDYYIDSRAGPRPHLEEQGQTCVVWDFDKEHKDEESGEVLEAIRFRMVSGEKIALNLVRELLSCRRNAEGLITRAPRFYVARKCRQTIWACENYTGISGERGASKDPIDNLRYIAGADLQHVDHAGPRSWRPGMDDEDE